MKAITSAAVVVLLAAGGSGSVSAQQRTGHVHFGIQCTPGALRACVSMDVETYYRPDGITERGFTAAGTEVRIRLANLQGLRGFEGSPFGFRGFSLSNLQGTSRRGIDADFTRGVANGSATVGAEFDNGHPVYDADSRATLPYYYDYAAMLFGCDLPADANRLHSYDQTCGGSITFSFFIYHDDLRLTGATALSFVGFVPAPGGGVWDLSRTDVGCTTGLDCVSVTPEPMTIALVGTGLSGIGLLRRRRRKPDEVS